MHSFFGSINKPNFQLFHGVNWFFLFTGNLPVNRIHLPTFTDTGKWKYLPKSPSLELCNGSYGKFEEFEFLAAVSPFVVERAWKVEMPLILLTAADAEIRLFSDCQLLKKCRAKFKILFSVRPNSQKKCGKFKVSPFLVDTAS
jgi:hypothetical protein